MKIDELADNLTSFYYDWDTYEFNDNYDSYEDGLIDIKNMLYDNDKRTDILKDLKSIREDIKNDKSVHISCLCKRCESLINNIEEYIPSINDDFEL